MVGTTHTPATNDATSPEVKAATQFAQPVDGFEMPEAIILPSASNAAFRASLFSTSILPSLSKYHLPADCIMMRMKLPSVASMLIIFLPVLASTALPISISLSQVRFCMSAGWKPAAAR